MSQLEPKAVKLLQDVLDSDLQSGYFQDQFLADELGGDALLALGGIDASAMVVGLGPPHKRLCHSSPLATADPAEPLGVGLPESISQSADSGPTLRVAPVRSQQYTLRARHCRAKLVENLLPPKLYLVLRLQ